MPSPRIPPACARRILLVLWLLPVPAAAAEAPGKLVLDSIPGARFAFGGVIGQRIERNVDAWLLPAPRANPGMLEIFRVRDRQPAPQLVPWAGEFAGKYLISLVQALRMTSRPELAEHARDFVRELIATQADDGYLGPFARKERLLGHWDLWGHYHVMQGLLLWHAHSPDEAAFRAAIKAADLICATYLDTGRRVLDAGSHEMNMAVIHVLGWLYRLTSTERYLRLLREIEKDWERAGDYLRQGLLGVDFYRTPTPRWESLHDLQGLVELYRITGEERYKTAFTNLWRSISALDVHNTGGFSSGEQAVGHPYSPAPIETCCTIAWMAITVDMLRLTGEATAADALEISTYNGMLGSQHPSGRWWTYNTPMDGVREASAHSIVFQARAGTPELNCCSVNGPRGLGMLSEWAVMADGDGLVLNYFGALHAELRLRDGLRVAIEVRGDYPWRAGESQVIVTPERPAAFAVKIRVPAGIGGFRIAGESDPIGRAGFATVRRTWRPGDSVSLAYDLAPRLLRGERQARGKASLYLGPVLLAYDQRFNDFDEAAIPAIDDAVLRRAVDSGKDRLPGAVLAHLDRPAGPLAPSVLAEVPAADGRKVVLCDFAAAGATGTRYRTWLPAVPEEHPQPRPGRPYAGEVVPAGKVQFRLAGPVTSLIHEFAVYEPGASTPLVSARSDAPEAILELPARAGDYLWKFLPGVDGVRFRVDPSLPPRPEPPPAAPRPRPDGTLVAAPLSRDAIPEHGQLQDVAGARAVESGLLVDGQKGRIRYSIPGFPASDVTVSVTVEPRSFPQGRIAQVFSAWAGPMDDPLRLTIDGGKLSARIEAGAGYSTPGVPLELGEQVHIAAVKAGPTLKLYVGGEERGAAVVPEEIYSEARNVALGGNPNFGGNEFLEAVLSRFTLHARALSVEEIRGMAGK